MELAYVLAEFDDLGAKLEKLWRQENYNEERFPRLAYQSLQDAQIHETGVHDRLLAKVTGSSNLPPQLDLEASFGDPPVTVYRGSRFYLAVYFWLDGRTDIHQHEFSGAFQVLSGHSVHTVYGFEQDTKVNSRLLLGRLSCRKAEILKAGDTRAISSGNRFIHSVFHLERPCLSLVARTYNEPPGPQYLYLPQHLAYDPVYREPSQVRRGQVLSYLFASGQEKRFEHLDSLLKSGELDSCFRALNRLGHHLYLGKHLSEETLVDWLRAKDLAVKHFGGDAERIAQAVEADMGLRWLNQRRANLENPALRDLLGLLLSVRNIKDFKTVVASRYEEEEPQEYILDTLEELQDQRGSQGQYLPIFGTSWGDEHIQSFEYLLTEESRGAWMDRMENEMPNVDSTLMAEELLSSPLLRHLEIHES